MEGEPYARRWAPLLAAISLCLVPSSSFCWPPRIGPPTTNSMLGSRREWDEHRRPFSGRAVPASAAAPSLASAPAARLVDQLLEAFVGDFDNFDQVMAERRAGVEPREGGGHEHIHCTVRQLPGKLGQGSLGYAGVCLVAMYYFNGDPRQLFRARCYTLHDAAPPSRSCGGGEVLQMRLWRLPPQVMAAAAAASAASPGDGKPGDGKASGVVTADAVAAAAGGAIAACTLASCKELVGCEVYWAATEAVAGGAVELMAHMEGGGCCVESERSPGKMLRVEDELRLSLPRSPGGGRLSIHDRGFDADNGALVYGNTRGVPYELGRVEPAGHLAWTLSGGGRGGGSGAVPPKEGQAHKPEEAKGYREVG